IGEAIAFRPVKGNLRNVLLDVLPEPGSQAKRMRGMMLEVLSRQRRCDAEAHNSSDVLGPGSLLALLCPATHERSEINTLAYIKGADAFGSVNLMRRERQQIYA